MRPVRRGHKMAMNNRLVHHSYIIFLVCFVLASTEATDTSSTHVNFVVVGATGSLAQKYLWQGMYDLRQQIAEQKFISPSVPDLVLYGGARAEASKGEQALRDILDKKVTYDSDDTEQAVNHFKASVRFVQLKTCEHYERLCRDQLNGQGASDGHCHADGTCDSPDDHTPKILSTDNGHSEEAGRIFYLAVPPYSYAEVAKCLHRVCRPSKSEAFLRLVLEKPFGTNVATVQSLVKSLQEDFQEEDIYLVDHYLGKPAVQHILEFRHLNRNWLEPLLNGHHVEKVEVAIKETEDVDGRLNYFDTYGVFLDVLQNHAVEMLCLTTMDLVSKSGDAIRREKLRFLRSIQPVHPDHVAAGQYEGYEDEGRREFARDDFVSATPTFGAVVLQVSNSRWRGVPFFLVAGKALDAKVSAVRITFKSTAFTMAESIDIKSPKNADKQAVISISTFAGSRPRLSVSRSIVDGDGGQSISSTWSEVQPLPSDLPDSKVYEFTGRDRAYSSVVADVYFGRRENFVGMEQLTAAWAIWDSYLKAAKTVRPRSYRKGYPQDLDVAWTPTGLHFVNDVSSSASENRFETLSPNFKFCNQNTVTKMSSVVKPFADLIKDVVRDLTDVIHNNDKEAFHLAIPGGRTPLPIFQELLSLPSFPWHKVHFWFTDERCVEHRHHHSNFLNAEEFLFKHLQLSLLNVHVMPVDLQSGLCIPQDNGAGLYAHQLERHLGANRSLDAILLGVGSDGHVASLFPDDLADPGSEDDWVKLTKAGQVHVVEQRMSITFKTIANAENVFLVITGKEKHGIVQELLNDGHCLQASRLPVKQISARKLIGVYADNDAYFS